MLKDIETVVENVQTNMSKDGQKEKKTILENIITEIQNDKNKQLDYYNKIYNLLNIDASQLVSNKEPYKIFYDGYKKFVPYADDIQTFDIRILGLCNKYRYLWEKNRFPFDNLAKIFKCVNKQKLVFDDCNHEKIKIFGNDVRLWCTHSHPNMMYIK